MVRAKFNCVSITRQNHWDKSKGELQTILLSPVCDGTSENQAFYAATPSGKIELGVLNKDAGDYFELGADYYVEFSKVE